MIMDISIDFVIVLLFLAIAFVFVLVCVSLITDNRELKKQRDKAQELYLREVERNIERLREDVFRDDIELLNSIKS
ncbi:hypothetical protein SAMN05216364_1005109 [Porphyromonadaceae bacterium KHP3R9]|nr:hypothetical protein SAMN05216357_112111 [Porphyromonadaceae bacterium KH3CP3RA]SFU35582.1 hypothetical protein SAMN05216364_1005109 [Porphyromonadaceae bacterium KHP3R9]